MMSRSGRRTVALAVTGALLVAACGGDDDTSVAPEPSASTVGASTDADGVAPDDDDDGGEETDAAASDGSIVTATAPTSDAGTEAEVDLTALGLWDDGACDASLAPLVVGNISPHESPVLSLADHVAALEAAADAFNARGGANGACIEVVACDDGNNFDQALQCAREFAGGDVVATINDADVIAAAEVSAALADAGIPRIGGNVAPGDWADINSYPIGTSTAVTFLLPDALIQEGATDIGIVRVDLPAAAAARGMFESTYTDDGATFVADVAVPAGTTDYSQFVLAAEGAGADGIMLALGAQEAIQVVRAGQQLGTDLRISASLGSFSYTDVVDLGEVASQMTFVWPVAPATSDVPVYAVLRDDLAVSGNDALQPEHLKSGAMMSWIALYGLLEMIREAGLSDLSRESITALANEAEDVPMLGIFGDETWTPALDYEGVWKRVGIDRYTYWQWDPGSAWGGQDGNFVLGGEISFTGAMCGSPLGAPGPC